MLFRFSYTEKFFKSFFEERKDFLLAEAKSEILKQECKVDSLNTCIREFQRPIHSHRLELDSASCGYEEFRREQAQFLVELAPRRKALRDIHATTQRLTSQIQEMQERVNYMNDSGEFQDVESICSGKYYLTFPVSWQCFQIHDLCRAATKACDLVHGICLGHKETFLATYEQ